MTVDLSINPELASPCVDLQDVHNRMRRLSHTSYELGPYATRDIVDALREELEETRKDYACLARHLDGHDATECLMNLRRLKEEHAELTEWKRQQMLVESSWNPQNIGHLLNMPIGTDIRANLEAAVREVVDDAWKYRDFIQS